MKRIIAILLLVVFTLSLVACSKDGSGKDAIKRPEIYDMKILSVNGEDITYEFYRYYYLFVKQSYEESGTEITEEKIKEDVLNKLLYDGAVHKLLEKYSLSLTQDEIKECEDYVAMYVSAYGDIFESQLESEMNMTLNVFTKMTINEMAYNKLYTYLADEKNKKVDFSDEAVIEYMKDFRAGMHLILGVADEKQDAEKKALIEKLYKIAEFENSFAPIQKLHNLRESLKEANKTLDDLNNQIANGNVTDELSATLKSIAEQISSLTAKITEEQSKINVTECLSGYLEKLEVYKEIVKKDVEAAVNSAHADILASLDSATSKELISKINSGLLPTATKTLAAELVNLADNKTKYGWFTDDFVASAKAFEKSATLENANRLLEIYSGNKDLKSDKTVAEIMDKFSSLATLLSSDKSAGEYHAAIASLNGYAKMSLTVYENAMLYASLREAQDTSKQLKDYTGSDIHQKLEDAYNVLNAPVTTFEELVIANSDDYEAEGGTVVFYLRQKDLLKELQDAVEGLEVGQMTTIVKSSAGYHVLKLVEPDIEYFKKNEYVYYLLEDMLNDETKNVEYTGSEIYNSINKAKMAEYETELKAQKNAIAQSGSSSGSKTDDNSALWTVLVIVITIVVVAVLVVLIVLASKPTPAPTHKNKNKNGTRKK